MAQVIQDVVLPLIPYAMVGSMVAGFATLAVEKRLAVVRARRDDDARR